MHLQRVAECKDCMMPAGNLAKVFGPTMVGYSESDPQPEMLLRQTADQQQVMNKLLAISTDYWDKFTRGDDDVSLFGVRESVGIIRTPDRVSHGEHRRRSIIGRTPLK